MVLVESLEVEIEYKEKEAKAKATFEGKVYEAEYECEASLDRYWRIKNKKFVIDAIDIASFCGDGSSLTSAYAQKHELKSLISERPFRACEFIPDGGCDLYESTIPHHKGDLLLFPHREEQKYLPALLIENKNVFLRSIYFGRFYDHGEKFEKNEKEYKKIDFSGKSDFGSITSNDKYLIIPQQKESKFIEINTGKDFVVPGKVFAIYDKNIGYSYILE